MHLLPCSPPDGPLEPAPRSALRDDSARERWEGFWCDADERFYTRCTSSDGSTQWYRLADDSTGILAFPGVKKPALKSRLTVLFSSTAGGRAILVGKSRRRAARAGDRR